ncbi:MAG: type II secretion system protein GspF [Alphaproteobacteria bacterium]|nr:type II secretion system protein GspF [Alphaproteobacteria bacterium]
MAAFDYIAIDENGKRHRGVIEADSARKTRQILRERLLTPLQIEEAGPQKASAAKSPGRSGGRVGLRDVSVITRQLATLVEAGLPVEQALQALSRQSEKPTAKSMLAAVRAQVLEGRTLAQSLAAFPRSFPELYRSSVHAGERTGHLDTVLMHLAQFMESSYQSRQKILLALLYPAILTAVSLMIIVFLMMFMVPSMVQVFVGAGQELPLLTRGLIAISGGLQSYGLVLLMLLGGGIYTAKKALRKPDIRAALDAKMLGWPVAGKFALHYNASRFATTLGMLHESGVPLLQALEIAAAVLPNLHMRAQVGAVARQVREGVSLSAAMEKSGVFPPVLITMVASGEASGQLGHMLERAGSIQQRDLENRIAVLLGLFEPMVLLVMGGFVLLLVLAIILPILNLNQLV